MKQTDKEQADREETKNKNSVARAERKQKICELVGHELYVPMKEKELAVMMQVSREDREELKSILDELLLEGRLQLTAKKKYIKGDGSVLTGVFISHPKGFGFVEVEGREEDLFIPASRVHGAMHRDTVRVSLLQGQLPGKRQEAEITDIIARGFSTLVGTYQQSRNYGFVVPDNPKFACDIFIPKEKTAGAVEGHKVLVEITDYGSSDGNGRNPEGKIIEILGHRSDPGVDILSVIKGYEFPVGFSEKEINQANRIAKPVSEQDRTGRMDLRDLTMVTIDGEDAKDLDDAVSLTLENGVYHLGVHIADVSNYVQENSALDHEAQERGTSVYLVDRVIPMLPHILSNGICSLNQGEDRLALSCLMTIDDRGTITDYQVTETVICVNRRMSYTEVRDILEEEQSENRKKHEDLYPMFRRMADLSAILRKKREQRGSVDFDFPESKIILDEKGHPTDIHPYERNIATDMIEDFMLAANETVAQHFFWQELPFVYRIHEAPDPDKIKKLQLLAAGMGYVFKTGQEEIHPKEVQKLLSRVEGTKEEAFISRMTLRSMKQAKYSTECTGHFGLACQYYCHFTSPIRRYPDLQIHRIIKEQLRGKLSGNRVIHYQAILPQVAKHSSEMERRADEAERETDKMKKAQYMADHLGEEYEGIVSGVTSWGIYVELYNTVEGMVPVVMMTGDSYHYDEEHCEMIGERTHRTYSLGQQVKVMVDRVDELAGNIDFVFAEGSDRRNGRRGHEAGSQ